MRLQRAVMAACGGGWQRVVEDGSLLTWSVAGGTHHADAYPSVQSPDAPLAPHILEDRAHRYGCAGSCQLCPDDLQRVNDGLQVPQDVTNVVPTTDGLASKAVRAAKATEEERTPTNVVYACTRHHKGGRHSQSAALARCTAPVAIVTTGVLCTRLDTEQLAPAPDIYVRIRKCR